MFRRPPKRPKRRRSDQPIDRAASAAEAIDLFNSGAYWEAHEALEAIWRSVDDESEATVLQGLIQAAAALLHRDRGNQHGVRVVGGAALDKLAGMQHPAVEFETERFSRQLRRALEACGAAPRLTLK